MSTQERLTAALDEVFASLNVLGSHNSKVVQDYFTRRHRTLQQQFVKTIVLPVLQQLASDLAEGQVDMRNAYAANLAEKMLAGVTEEDTYLPLI